MKQELGLLLNRHQREIRKLQKISSTIDTNSLTFEKLIQILQKHKEKNLTEISALKYFCLRKTNLITKFTEDKLDEASYDLILSISLSSSFLKIFNRDDLIINIGQPCTNLFIVLKGKAAAFGIKKYHLEVTGYEYFILLKNLKNNDDMHLIEKIILENNRIYPIDIEDMENLEKIVLKIYLSSKFKRASPKYLEDILNRVGMKLSDFELESYLDMVEKKHAKEIKEQEDVDWGSLTEEEKIEKYKELDIYNVNDAWNYTLLIEKKILDQLNYIDIELMKKYTFLTKMINEEMITYYKCEIINEIEENEYFGNSENGEYLNKVVSLSDDLNVMCIKADLYNEYVRRVNSKIIGSQINFLLDNFYFHPLYKGFFEKYYFKYFELVEYKLKQIIVKENDPIDYIYFIKSGSAKLTSTRSIAENHILIELIKNILLKSNKGNMKEIKSEINNLYNNVTNHLEYFSNDMKIKNRVHIMTLQSNNCIGSECMYYGFKYLYSAEVISEKVELYKISIDKIMRIINDKTSPVFYYYCQYSEQNLKLFFNRLTRINNMLLANLNKSKIRQFGDIFNLNVENFQESIYKNDIKFTNKKDILSFETLKQNSHKIIKDKLKSRNKLINLQNLESSKDKKNLDSNNLNSKIFITQKPKTPYYTKINRKKLLLRKEKEKSENKDDLTQKIIENLKRNNTLNLFPLPKDKNKDMTSHIKFFDYKENLEKLREKEEIRARKGLILLEKKEKNQMEKIKNETFAMFNSIYLSLGKKRNLVIHSGQNEDQEEKNFYDSFSSNNNIFNLYNRNIFKKNKMIMTSLYKNKFSEYFDIKLGAKNFKYDLSKTLLSNKKKFEYSIFDKRFTKKFWSVPKKRDRYDSLICIKNNKSRNKTRKISKNVDKKIDKFESIKVIPIRSIKLLIH